MDTSNAELFATRLGLDKWDGNLPKGAFRVAYCPDCEHEWKHETRVTGWTSNLTGETSAYCPICGKRAATLSPVYVPREGN